MKKNTVRWLRIGVTAAVLVALGFYVYTNWGLVQEFLEDGLSKRTPPFFFLVLMLILPAFGFPISVFLVLSGIVYGMWLGLAAMAGTTAVHLLFSFWVGKSFLRQPLMNLLRKLGYDLPDVPEDKMKYVTFTFFVIPGLSYAIKNYLFALTNVPFRVYFGIALPVNCALGFIFVVLGDSVSNAKWPIFGAIFLVFLVIQAVVWWLKKKKGGSRGFGTEKN